MIAVLVVLLATAGTLIVGLAMRPTGGLAIPSGSQVVHVDERDFQIAFHATTTLHPGNYVFVDTNYGPSPHELVMWKTNDPVSGLPMAKNNRVNEESTGLDAVLDSGSSLSPGETRLLSVSLDPGHYILVCNLPGHFNSGMHVDLTVSH
jgi:uncharacterized cupredoxin-like copper-binding protein